MRSTHRVIAHAYAPWLLQRLLYRILKSSCLNSMASRTTRLLTYPATTSIQRILNDRTAFGLGKLDRELLALSCGFCFCSVLHFYLPLCLQDGAFARRDASTQTTTSPNMFIFDARRNCASAPCAAILHCSDSYVRASFVSGRTELSCCAP